jgi:REP element-mobilizing transposase RayT
MRMARIKISGRGAVYHCMSRVVGGQRLLGPLEKEKLREMLWQQAAFSGVEIITYCLMANHIHLLVRIGAQNRASDAQLVDRALKFYGKKSLYVQTLRKALEEQGALPEDLREGLRERMGDVSAFMKELKQRFSKWYNRQQNRYGTLWAERFKSVLVEDQPSAVQAVAAYVDLNGVRGGLVKDPKELGQSPDAAYADGNPTAGKCADIVEHQAPGRTSRASDGPATCRPIDSAHTPRCAATDARPVRVASTELDPGVSDVQGVALRAARRIRLG